MRARSREATASACVRAREALHCIAAQKREGHELQKSISSEAMQREKQKQVPLKAPCEYAECPVCALPHGPRSTHTIRAGVTQAKEEERARLDAEALFAKKIEAMALNAKLQLVRRQARPEPAPAAMRLASSRVT